MPVFERIGRHAFPPSVPTIFATDRPQRYRSAFHLPVVPSGWPGIRTCYKPQQKLGAGLYDRKKSGFEAYRRPMLRSKRRAGSLFDAPEGFRAPALRGCSRHSGAKVPPFRCHGSSGCGSKVTFRQSSRRVNFRILPRLFPPALAVHYESVPECPPTDGGLCPGLHALGSPQQPAVAALAWPRRAVLRLADLQGSDLRGHQHPAALPVPAPATPSTR